ncbi:MAG: hypothetical protein WD847_01370 [Pirellulales bacterium]
MASANERATQVWREVELSPAAAAALDPGDTAGQFVQRLLERGASADAAKVLAQALPRREAVRWACWCAAQVEGPTPQEAAALAAAEAWVADPSEEHRRAAMDAAKASPLGTAAGCAAMAAFLSEGSLGPEGIAAIPPGEALAGRAVGGAVLLAGVARKPEKANEKYARFVKKGLEALR